MWCGPNANNSSLLGYACLVTTVQVQHRGYQSYNVTHIQDYKQASWSSTSFFFDSRLAAQSCLFYKECKARSVLLSSPNVPAYVRGSPGLHAQIHTCPPAALASWYQFNYPGAASHQGSATITQRWVCIGQESCDTKLACICFRRQ